MAKRQNFVVGSTNAITQSLTTSELNHAFDQYEILTADELDGVFNAVSDYSNDSSNEIANAIKSITGADPAGTSQTELADALQQMRNEILTSSLTFVGYVATSEPDPTVYELLEDNLWINSSTMPITFPISASLVKKWDGSAWVAYGSTYTPNDFEAFRNLNDGQGYYWFGGQWVVMSTDLSTDYFFLNPNTGKWEISSTYNNTLVHRTGNETIDGTKTFSSTISGNINGSSASCTGNAATVTNGVYTTGNQTIGGTKTFSSTIQGSVSGSSTSCTGNAATVTNGVYTVGNQIIDGTKTFKSSIRFQAGNTTTYQGFMYKLTSNNSLCLGISNSGNTEWLSNISFSTNGNITLSPSSSGVVVVPTVSASSNGTIAASTAWVKTYALGVPDWSSQTGISTPWTATKNGYIYAYQYGGDAHLRVFINQTSTTIGNAGYHYVGGFYGPQSGTTASGLIPVRVGDVVSLAFTNTAYLYFVPCKNL